MPYNLHFFYKLCITRVKCKLGESNTFQAERNETKQPKNPRGFQVITKF